MKENKSEIPSVFVIQNPVAGTSDQAAVRAEIESHLAGRKYQIYETTKQDNVREVVKDAIRQGYRMIWAAGGDGTVSAAANALAKGNVPMGIVPLGTGNVLARELGIPLDLTAACDLLTGPHQIRVLDVLQVGEEYFVLSVSAGISALTMAGTDREQKRRLGQLAYFLNGARVVFSRSLWPFQVSVDGQPFFVRASEVMVANIGLIGYEPLRLGEQVRPDDGRVDLCHARLESIPKMLTLFAGLLSGRQDELDELTCHSVTQFIEIKSRRRVPVQGDGEHIGFTPVRIEVVPNSLPVIVPVPEK